MTKPFLKKIITSIATKSNWVSLAVTLTAPWSRSKRKMEILPFPFHHLLLPPIFFPSLSSLSYRYLHLPPNIIFIQEGHPLRCCQPGGRAWTGQICPTGRHEQCTHSSTTGLAGCALPSLQKNRGSAGAAETFRSGSPPAAILLPPLLLHFIWSNYDFCALILPDSYLCVTYFCKTWIKGHNLRNLCCTCSSIFAVSPQQQKITTKFCFYFSSAGPGGADGRGWYGTLGNSDTYRISTVDQRTPVHSSPTPCCTAGGEWEFWTLWGLAIIALPANTAVTAAVVTDGWWVGGYNDPTP